MTAPSVADSFTEREYAELLDLAAARYRFVDAGSAASSEPCVVWRHDIDYSPHRALALAAIEHARGVRCVYHVMTASRYYNVFEPEIGHILQRISAYGHYCGVHIDMDVFGEHASAGAVVRRIEIERTVLESVLGKVLTSLSFHNYTLHAARLATETEIGGMFNLSAPSNFKPFRYVSDSNGIWRYDRLRDVLNGDIVPRLLVLTHPEWWTPEPMPPIERLHRAIDGRARANRDIYIATLKREGRYKHIAETIGAVEPVAAGAPGRAREP